MIACLFAEVYQESHKILKDLNETIVHESNERIACYEC